MQMRLNKHLSGRLIAFLSLIAVWEGLDLVFPGSRFFLSRPTDILSELQTLLLHDNLHVHFAVTATEAFVGAFLGTLIGAIVGLSFWYSRILADVARPFVLVAASVPVIAFAPLFILWFGVGIEMKIAIAFFSTVFPALAQAYRGANEVSQEYVDVLEGMRASRSKIFTKAIIPGALTWVLNSMRLNVGLGLLGAFMGEFIASQEGLGYLMLRAAALYNVSRAFAAAIGMAVLALLFDFFAQWVEQKRLRIVELISVPRLIWRR